jgi:ubiquinol-cytochrome c reductase cytochrome c subunit
LIHARAIVTIVVCATAFGLTGCAYVDREPVPYRAGVVETGALESGRSLYLRDCAWCHGDRGEGTERAPDLVSGTNGAAFTDFMLSTGRMPVSSSEERTRRRPPAYNAPQIAVIVEYVAGLGGAGPAVPSPTPEEGHLGLGLELYQENCAACHSTTLVGGALAAGREGQARSLIAPDLTQSTPREIAEAMLVGPGAMPVFGEDVFTKEEVDSIVRYVVALQDPKDPGGAPIGHIGPVAEGAVGLLVGVGALIVLIRWIGTRIGEQ